MVEHAAVNRRVVNSSLTEAAKRKQVTLGEMCIRDRVYINCFEYETLPWEKTFFEAHEEYADIHFLISGEENIGISAPEVLRETERDPKTDFIGYKGEVETLCKMTPEKVLIVFPGEAHMVKVQRCGPVAVQKAVVKVKI